jgi:hypothetical protein
VRDGLERRLVEELREAACFSEVFQARLEEERQADFTLELLIGGFRQESEFDYGVHRTDSPDLDTSRRAVSRIEAEFRATLLRLPERVTVRQRRFEHRASQRPRWQEEARELARRAFIEGGARALRKFACKASRRIALTP